MDKDIKWDLDFIDFAKQIAIKKSKDPSTKAGAVIVAPDRSIVSVGYNGFARGVKDSAIRYKCRNNIKYKIVVHAEINAIVHARKDLANCSIFIWPLMSCAACAAVIIQSGIIRCVAPTTPPELNARWGRNTALSKIQFREAGVQLDLIDFPT